MPGPAAGPARRSPVRALPIDLKEGDPGLKRVGELTFLRGWELTSSDSRFGGISGLAFSGEAATLYAVSDRGYWLAADIRHDPDGYLLLPDSWEIAPLLGVDGAPVQGRMRDAEALTRDHQGGFIVSFEQVHRLWRYPVPFISHPEVLATPPGLERAPFNGGLEGVTMLRDGQLLLVTEDYENPDRSLKGWLVRVAQSSGGEKFEPISYLPSDGFQPTDLATLPSGDVLVLERRYRLLEGASARVKWLSREWIRPGARLEGKEIVHLAPPLTVDNFEGLAVHEDRRGEILVYLISDDNYQPFQRTLLLQFRWRP